MMQWQDERYVRLFIRDTTGWLMMPWQARALLPQLLRKFDRAGVIDLGEYGAEAIPTVVAMPADVVEPGLAALLKRETLVLRGQFLVMPNYVEAQECNQSDKTRKAEHRARYRDRALAEERGLVTLRDVVSQNGTSGPESGQEVTRGHTASHAVTPCRAVPNHAVPQQHAAGAGAGVVNARVKTARGERLPDGWEPTPGSYVAAADEAGFGAADVNRVLVEFRDFWRGVPGQRGRKLDWDATFRNRLREVGGRRGGQSPSSAIQKRARSTRDEEGLRVTEQAIRDAEARQTKLGLETKNGS